MSSFLCLAWSFSLCSHNWVYLWVACLSSSFHQWRYLLVTLLSSCLGPSVTLHTICLPPPYRPAWGAVALPCSPVLCSLPMKSTVTPRTVRLFCTTVGLRLVYTVLGKGCIMEIFFLLFCFSCITEGMVFSLSHKSPLHFYVSPYPFPHGVAGILGRDWFSVLHIILLVHYLLMFYG